MKEVTLDVVQGIGDIFWVHQKMYPYFDRVNYNVLMTCEDETQRRSLKFLPLLPKCGEVKAKVVDGAFYNRVATWRFGILPILDNPSIVHQYAVNRPLEEGIRLEAIDIGAKVEWGVQWQVPDASAKEGDYLMLYVSGSSRHYHDKFSPEQWAMLYATMLKRHSLAHLPVVLIGASYDAWMQKSVLARLQQQGIQAEMVIDGAPDVSIRLLRDAKLLVGFQSGLNVIADNYDTPVIMVDFNHLKTMAHSWCKPGHVEANMFKEFVFSDGVDAIIQGADDIISGVKARLSNK